MKNGPDIYQTDNPIMKINKIFLILFLLSQCISAQVYKPVLHKDSTSWDVGHYELFGIMMEDLFCNTYVDSTYSKLFLNGMLPGTIYLGKVREDTNSGKVWYIDQYGNPEKIIMDMDLSIGDTFRILPTQISTVDSVYYQDGRKNIRFDLQTTMWDEAVRFIEGVGPNVSLAYAYAQDWFFVSCKYDASDLVYITDNQNFIGCNPDLSALEEKLNNEKFEIFPNPAYDYINFEINFPLNEYLDFELFDCYGRRVKEVKLKRPAQTLSLLGINEGLYLYIIRNKNLIVGKGKILVVK